MKYKNKKNQFKKKNSSQPRLTRLTCDLVYEIGITLPKKNVKNHEVQDLIT